MPLELLPEHHNCVPIASIALLQHLQAGAGSGAVPQNKHHNFLLFVFTPAAPGTGEREAGGDPCPGLAALRAAGYGVWRPND